MSPRLGAAIRFAVALAVVDISAFALFGPGTLTTAASFATIGALYFLDYDGQARERVMAYSVSTLVALVGIFLGAAVQGSLILTVVVAFVVGFAFAAARALRGFIARSFVGTQLAFVLAVFTSHAWTNVASLAGGWLFGSVVSTVCALLIFPRHHAGALRVALSRWCKAAADFVRGGQAERARARAEMSKSLTRMEQIDRGEMLAGLWSPRTRALASMTLHVQQVTDYLELSCMPVNGGLAMTNLSEATAEGFAAAAEMVPLDGRPVDFAPVVEARDEHFEAVRTHGATPVSFYLRVLSVASESLQILAAASHRWKHPAWPLLLERQPGVRSFLRDSLNVDSVWLFHGLRTGLALAGAIALATSLGLHHGVWVVMTTLSVINVSFTASGSTINAGKVAGGVLGGVTVSALFIAFAHQWWMFAVAVTLLALCAKWFLPTGPFMIQLTYAPLAVLNVELLGWPTSSGLDVSRVEDILIGAAVAVVATALTFPFGMQRLVERTWLAARSAAERSVGASLQALRERTQADPRFARDQAVAFARATDVVDTALAGARNLGNHEHIMIAHKRWLNLAMLTQVGVDHLAQLRRGIPVGDPGEGILVAWGEEAGAVLTRALGAENLGTA